MVSQRLSLLRTEVREYLNIREKVDLEFDRLFDKHRAQMACHEGCHDCCAPELSVTRVEADQIKSYLAEHPRLVERLQTLSVEDPHGGARCSLLDAAGRCSIYEVRPLICRSHGAPVLVQIDEKREGLDSCPKNFQRGMSMLEVGDWINIETLNTMTALIDWRYALDQGREKPDPEHDRVGLNIEELLS